MGPSSVKQKGGSGRKKWEMGNVKNGGRREEWRGGR